MTTTNPGPSVLTRNNSQDVLYDPATGNMFAGSALLNLSPQYSLQTPLTGFSITIPNAVNELILSPAGTLATGTIILPSLPQDRQWVGVTSSQTVTALTVSANTGQTVVGAPTTITASTPFSFIYNASGAQWYRIG